MASAATFASEAGRQALMASARAIEEQSGAEVVIAVRARAAHYLHAHLLAGVAAGSMTLWFQLFSPWEFSLLSIFLAPLAVGVAAGFVTETSPVLQRLLTPASLRASSVRAAARAAFVDLGLADTRGRTGVLVYVACLERSVEVVLDRGVKAAAGLSGWVDAVDAMRSAVAGDDARRAAEAMRRLGPLLAAVASRGEDDENEIPDTVNVA